MAKLAVCRICLDASVQHVVKNTELQELYEKFTTTPFHTADMRPLALCYICHGQLKASHRLMLRCLMAEELLTEMLNHDPNEDEAQKLQIDRSALKQMSISITEQLSIDSTVRDDVIHQFDVKLEEQNLQDIQEPAVLEPDNEWIVPKLEDPLSNIETAREQEEVGVGGKQRKAALIATNPKLKPEVNKPTNDIKHINTDNDEAEASKSKFNDNMITPVVSDKHEKKMKNASNNSLADSIAAIKKLILVQKRYINDSNDDPSSSPDESNLKTCILNDEIKYMCNICKKCFKDNNNLMKHVRVHTSGKSYVCNVCKKIFKTPSLLKRHQIVHTDEKPYHCSMCKKSFKYAAILKQHLLVHTDEKPFYCNVCNKGYGKKSQLKIHARVHTGEKSHMCGFCGRNFNQKNDLVNHIRRHTGEKPYVCNDCGKCFRQQATLAAHAVIHTGEKRFVCDDCGKSYYTKGNLTTHIRIHTSKDLFNCDVCGKKFNLKGDLKKHGRCHTGEKSYACHVCKKFFG